MGQPELHAKKILLVDDEPDIIEFLSYNFRKRGYEVFTAYDGKHAIQVVENNRPDLIITDILMPKMNGITMCQQIKSNLNLNELPIIFLSATNDDLFAVAAMKAGGSRYVSKPIRFNALNEMVKDLLLEPQQEYFKTRYKPN